MTQPATTEQRTPSLLFDALPDVKPRGPHDRRIDPLVTERKLITQFPPIAGALRATTTDKASIDYALAMFDSVCSTPDRYRGGYEFCTMERMGSHMPSYQFVFEDSGSEAGYTVIRCDAVDVDAFDTAVEANNGDSVPLYVVCARCLCYGAIATALMRQLLPGVQITGEYELKV